MLKQVPKVVVYVSVCVLVAHILLDLQLIIGDRYTFLDDVRVSITFRNLSDEHHYKVWRQTLDNKTIELADKAVDSLHKTITYQNVPRSTFIRNLYVDVDSSGLLFNSIQVVIGKQVMWYSQSDYQHLWQSTPVAVGIIRHTLPTKNILPTSLLPDIGSLINWKGDWLLVSCIFQHNLNIILFIILFIFLSDRQSWLDVIFRSYKNKTGLVVFCFCITLLKSTFQVWNLDGDIDPSFRVGLTWASANHFRWGTDLIFTYGPYFWIAFTSIISPVDNLYRSFGVNLLLTFFSFWIILSYIKKIYENSRINHYALLSILLFLTIYHFDFLDYLVLSVLLLLFTTIKQINSNKSKYYALLRLDVAISLLSLLSLIKFSYIAFALSQLIILSCIFVGKKRMYELLSIWLVYPICFILFWHFSGQTITDIPDYLTNGFEIASGYTEAMSSPLWDNTSIFLINATGVLFLIVALVVLCLLLLFFVFSYQQKNVVVAAFLSAPMVFLAFKEGFVRFDPPHMALFYSQILLLTIVYFLVAAESGILFNSVNVRLLLVVTIVACCVAPAAQLDSSRTIPLLLDQQTTQQKISRQRNELIDSYKINSGYASLLKGATGVDIIPTNIALLYALGVTWKPRPVIQSYSVYTAKLSTANGDRYAGKESPEYVLFNLQSIDNRYALFDEPALVRTLLKEYSVYANQSNSYLLLKHRSVPLPTKEIVEKSVNYQLNQAFPIHTVTQSETFMSADINLTQLGKLMNIAYKIPPLRIKLKTKNGLYIHKAIRRNLADGILVSTYIKDINDMEALLNSTDIHNVTSIQIMGSPLFYERLMHVSMHTYRCINLPGQP